MHMHEFKHDLIEICFLEVEYVTMNRQNRSMISTQKPLTCRKVFCEKISYKEDLNIGIDSSTNRGIDQK